MYCKFPSLYIRTAILFAFWAGVSMGTHVAFTIGFDFPLGKGAFAYIQTHGYLQLMGWVGLFIMGISFVILSRLAHFNHFRESYIKLIYILMVSGLIIRFISHSLLPYLTGFWYLIMGGSIIISSILVFLAIIIYILFLLSIVFHTSPIIKVPNRDIRYFLIMNIFGWIIYGLANVILLSTMVNNGQIFLPRGINLLLVDLFIHFTIFPICIAIGLRALPLFLKLKKVDWNARNFSIIYLIIVSIYFILKAINLLNDDIILINETYLLAIIKDLIIAWFIFKLNILFRDYKLNNRISKNISCSKKEEFKIFFSDYGKLGHFELFIQSAFIWLSIGLFLDILLHVMLIQKIQIDIGIDGIRHMWLTGFTSLLIIGMSIRMIPGMTDTMKLKHPDRVIWLVRIINFSILFRTIYLVIPESILLSIPSIGIIALRLFGLSGILFMFGLLVFYYLMAPILNNNLD